MGLLEFEKHRVGRASITSDPEDQMMAGAGGMA
jgi:hypothetical protein